MGFDNATMPPQLPQMNRTTNDPHDPHVTKLTALLRALVTAYTRFHDALKIDGLALSSGIQVSMQAHRDDHPRLVGSKGTHIWAVQTLLAFAGRRAGRAVRVTLLEPAIGDKLPLEPYAENPKWKPEPMLKLLRSAAAAVFGDTATVDFSAVGEMTVFEIAPGAALGELMREAEIENAFHLIFHAIGKAQGRIVHVHVLDDKKTAQPLAANGATV